MDQIYLVTKIPSKEKDLFDCYDGVIISHVSGSKRFHERIGSDECGVIKVVAGCTGIGIFHGRLCL